jgi:hypothetical protein
VITALTLILIVVAATAAGVFLGGGGLRYVGLSLGGSAAIVATFAVFVALPNPTDPGGESWAGRTNVIGHATPNWQAHLMYFSAWAWFLTILAVASARSWRALERRPTYRS